MSDLLTSESPPLLAHGGAANTSKVSRVGDASCFLEMPIFLQVAMWIWGGNEISAHSKHLKKLVFVWVLTSVGLTWIYFGPMPMSSLMGALGSGTALASLVCTLSVLVSKRNQFFLHLGSDSCTVLKRRMLAPLQLPVSRRGNVYIAW